MDLQMSIGESGRVVIEIEPDLKRELHVALRHDGTNLKTWFVEQATSFLSERRQISLAFAEGLSEDSQ
jgi:hypothetical protein